MDDEIEYEPEEVLLYWRLNHLQAFTNEFNIAKLTESIKTQGDLFKLDSSFPEIQTIKILP